MAAIRLIADMHHMLCFGTDLSMQLLRSPDYRYIATNFYSTFLKEIRLCRVANKIYLLGDIKLNMQSFPQTIQLVLCICAYSVEIRSQESVINEEKQLHSIVVKVNIKKRGIPVM